jgi:hypothetical protein
LNFATASFANEIGLPVRRWGGNTTSRYNWSINAYNHALDWFFHNDTYANPYSGATETADDWVTQNQAWGTASLITIPMDGYVAKDGNQSTCAFSVAKYGPQQETDAVDGFPDCGNGLDLGGNPITDNDPLDTSVVSNPASATAWVQHLTQAHGAAATGGVADYALDNEPGLWHETQRDVHPSPFSYDESYSLAVAYAAAIKGVDPGALVFGPVQDGWLRYFYASYQSQAQAQQDYQNHGSVYFVPWYLQQMQAYEQTNHQRLLDYLDLHYYPQEANVSLATAGDANTQALRLRSTRSLWDPTYVDESWIGNAGLQNGIVDLIPTMHLWVDANYPGTRLALTEYNWGGLEDINGALAQADVLGIFGREGLDLAALWNYPSHVSNGQVLDYDNFDTLPGAYAFRLYRNYDGQGSKFGETSIQATSSDQSQLAIYAAQRSADGALTIVVINKTGSDLSNTVVLANFSAAATAQVYVYDSANLNAIVRQADQPVGASGLSATFPAASLTLFVVPPAGAPPVSGTPTPTTSATATPSATSTLTSPGPMGSGTATPSATAAVIFTSTSTPPTSIPELNPQVNLPVVLNGASGGW